MMLQENASIFWERNVHFPHLLFLIINFSFHGIHLKPQSLIPDLHPSTRCYKSLSCEASSCYYLFVVFGKSSFNKILINHFVLHRFGYFMKCFPDIVPFSVYLNRFPNFFELLSIFFLLFISCICF